MPLSQRPKNIEVTLKDKSVAVHDLKTGELKWDFKLEPNRTNELGLKYLVKFPKGQAINLE